MSEPFPIAHASRLFGRFSTVSSGDVPLKQIGHTPISFTPGVGKLLVPADVAVDGLT